MKPWMKWSLIGVGGLLGVWVFYRAFFRRGETVTETESVPVPLMIPSGGNFSSLSPGPSQLAGVSSFPDEVGLTLFDPAALIAALTKDAVPTAPGLPPAGAPNPFIPKPAPKPAVKPAPKPAPKAPAQVFKPKAVTPVVPKPPAFGLPVSTAQKLGDMFGVPTAQVFALGKTAGPTLKGQLTSYSAAEKLGNLFKVPTAKVLSLTKS